MGYRSGPVVIVRETWDLFHFGPHEFKIVTLVVGKGQRVLMSQSSPIIGPRGLLERVLAGDIPEGPIEFQVESGNTYRLEGDFRPTRSCEHHSAIARPAPRSRWQRLVDRWRP